MTFNQFIDWKPDNRRFELHHGTPVEMQPTGDHEEIISFLKFGAGAGNSSATTTLSAAQAGSG